MKIRRVTVKRQAAAGAQEQLAEFQNLDPSLCIFRHVTKTSRAVAALYDEAFDASGMTGHQFNLMMTLHRAGPLTVGALARLVGMDASTVPRAVAPLLEKSWLSVASGADRRQRIIALMPKGRTRLMAAVPAWARVQRRLIHHIGNDQWLTTIVALKSIRDGASQAAGGGTRR